MTDTAASPRPHAGPITAGDARTKKRNAAEARFRYMGIGAILIGLAFLVILVVSIVRSGVPAFTRTIVQIEYTITQDQFDTAESAVLKTAAYTRLFSEFVADEAAGQGVTIPVTADALERILGRVGTDIRSYFRENPDEIGTPVTFSLTAASRVDAYVNGDITRDGFVSSRFLETEDLDVIDALRDAGIITQGIDTTFFFGADSGVDNPGGAGIGASVVGSFFMMLVVLVLSLPISVAASIYLEEFAPKNRWTDLIEVNISNLSLIHISEPTRPY